MPTRGAASPGLVFASLPNKSGPRSVQTLCPALRNYECYAHQRIDCSTVQPIVYPWSRNGEQTAWVRKAQISAGNGWGHMHCPRPGDEVLVAFEHGNVDRPVIVGCLYNGNTKPPLPLPEAAHIHVFSDQGGNLFTLNPQDNKQTITLSSPAGNASLTLGADTENPS